MDQDTYIYVTELSDEEKQILALCRTLRRMGKDPVAVLRLAAAAGRKVEASRALAGGLKTRARNRWRVLADAYRAGRDEVLSADAE